MADYPNQHKMTFTLKVHPKCNHPEFVPTCLYCVDGLRVARKIFMEVTNYQTDTMYEASKVKIILATNPDKEHKP